MTSEITTVEVRLQDREDGGLRVTSAAAPGLLLSGADRQHVWNLIAPTLAGLLRANHGYDVAKVYYPSTSPGDPAPSSAAFHVEHFAVELRRAA